MNQPGKSNAVCVRWDWRSSGDAFWMSQLDESVPVSVPPLLPWCCCAIAMMCPYLDVQ